MVNPKLPNATYGFRFQSSNQLHLPMCQLYAVGHDDVTTSSYYWDGMQRQDGPLLLFQYTISGKGRLQIEDQIVQLNSETAFLVEIPSEHRYYFVEQDEHWEFFFILFRPHTVMPIWNEIIERIGRLPSLPYDSEPIAQLEKLFVAAGQGSITSSFIASSYVYSFMMALRQYCDHTHHISTIPSSISKAIEWIDLHYANMVGQEQLAEQVGLSKYHFIRHFTKYVGLTPNEYVNRKRIEKSIELLLSTEFNLEQIANAVGYSNASYYIRVFRKIIGQTPSSFRAKTNSLQYNKLYFQ